MVAELRKTNKSLYETDYNLWVLETVQKLQCRDLDDLDWEKGVGNGFYMSQFFSVSSTGNESLTFEHGESLETTPFMENPKPSPLIRIHPFMLTS